MGAQVILITAVVNYTRFACVQIYYLFPAWLFW
jgi:hypothetical protein